MRGLTGVSARGPALRSVAPTIALAAVLVLSMLPVVSAAASAPSAAASPPFAPGNAGWAYGFVQVANISGNDSTGTWEGNLTVGFVATINETATSPTGFQLSASETLGLSLDLEHCSPDCRAPVAVSRFSDSLWQRSSALANFETNITVNGSFSRGETPSPAVRTTGTFLGLVNATGSSNGGVALTFGEYQNGSLQQMLRISAGYRDSAVESFSPALAVLPTENVSLGERWSSTSLASASVLSELNWSELNVQNVSGQLVENNASQSLTIGPDNFSGTVTVHGRVGRVVALDGSPTLYAIVLNVDGPFGLEDSLVVLPRFLGPFAEQNPVLTGLLLPVSVGLAPAEIDLDPGHPGGHGILAASLTYAPSVSEPGGSAGNDSLGNQTVQGQPMTPGEAAATSSCLQTGNCGPSALVPIGGGGASVSWLGSGLLIGSAVLVVAIALLLVVGRRRQIPPPRYPNAGLYPPTQAPAPPSPPETGSPRRTEPPADDPLESIW